MKRIFLLSALLLALGLTLPVAASAQSFPGLAQTWLVTWAKSDNNFSQDVSATHVTVTNKGTTPFACDTIVVFYDVAGAVACVVGGPVPPANSRTLCSAAPATAVSSNCSAVCGGGELFNNYEGYARVYVGTSLACQRDIVVDARVHFTPQDETNASAIHDPNVVRTRPLIGASTVGAQLGD